MATCQYVRIIQWSVRPSSVSLRSNPVQHVSYQIGKLQELTLGHIDDAQGSMLLLLPYSLPRLPLISIPAHMDTLTMSSDMSASTKSCGLR